MVSKEIQCLVSTRTWYLTCFINCSLAERAEQLGYNALPATITSDMWAHQYLQQDNEMNAIHSDDHVWYSDGPDATL